MQRVKPEEVSCWKTGSSTPDKWIEDAINLIKKHGAILKAQAYGNDTATGEEAYMIAFSIGGDDFRIIWPILQPRQEKDRLAAKRQAATLLHHDVKARLIYAEVHGFRNAFLPMLLVEGIGGHKIPLGQMATPELTTGFPNLLKSGE